jgi:hypothetical protein
MLLGLLDTDPLVGGMYPAPDKDRSIIKQKNGKKTLITIVLLLLLTFYL